MFVWGSDGGGGSGVLVSSNPSLLFALNYQSFIVYLWDCLNSIKFRAL